jgi:hypothetical protein
MRFVNLTPHSVTVGELTVPPSGTVARLLERESPVSVNGIQAQCRVCGDWADPHHPGLCLLDQGTVGGLGGCGDAHQFIRVSLYKLVEGKVEGIPELDRDTIYIVSRPVSQAVRVPSVVAPHRFIRNADGQVIGAEGLAYFGLK